MCIPGTSNLSTHICNLIGLLKPLYNAEKLTMEGLLPLMEDGERLSRENVRPMLQVLFFLAQTRP